MGCDCVLSMELKSRLEASQTARVQPGDTWWTATRTTINLAGQPITGSSGSSTECSRVLSLQLDRLRRGGAHRCGLTAGQRAEGEVSAPDVGRVGHGYGSSSYRESSGGPRRLSPQRLEARMNRPRRPGSSARTAPRTVATTMMNEHADSQL